MTASILVREPSLVRHTGIGYFPIALVARLPFAMIIVGMLTLVVSVRGSVALGGITAAATGLGTAALGPFLGAAADRWGQRRVLVGAAVANSAALVAMAFIVPSPLPDAALLVNAFLIGATAPQVSPMSRSRLVEIIGERFSADRRQKTLGATMAYESAADEIVFVFGPVLVGVLAMALNPAAPILAAAAISLAFVVAFALHPTGRTAAHGAAAGRAPQAPASELARPALVITVIGTTGVGLFFGAMLTSLTAFMADSGAPEQAGLVYGAMGLSSAILALGVALLPQRFGLSARWLVFGGIILAGTVAFASADSTPAVVLALLITGVGVGPTLVTLYHLAAHRTPAGRSATVMTMVGAGIIVGQASASALTGMLADDLGAGAAMLAPLVAAAVIVAAGAADAIVGARARAHR